MFKSLVLSISYVHIFNSPVSDPELHSTKMHASRNIDGPEALTATGEREMHGVFEKDLC